MKKYVHKATNYNARKVANYTITADRINNYSYILAVTIDEMPANIQAQFRIDMINNNHHTIKVMNKIIAKVFNDESLKNIFKNQITLIMTENPANAMKVCSSYARQGLKQLFGLENGREVSKKLLSMMGTEKEIMGRLFSTMQYTQKMYLFKLFAAMKK